MTRDPPVPTGLRPAAGLRGTGGAFDAAGWVFGLLVLAIAVANLVLVHPVPAAAYALVALVYLPPANRWLRRRWGWRIPVAVKAVLGIIVVMFTLGVSDLGDMLD